MGAYLSKALEERFDMLDRVRLEERVDERQQGRNLPDVGARAPGALRGFQRVFEQPHPLLIPPRFHGLLT